MITVRESVSVLDSAGNILEILHHERLQISMTPWTFQKKPHYEPPYSISEHNIHKKCMLLWQMLKHTIRVLFEALGGQKKFLFK